MSSRRKNKKGKKGQPQTDLPEKGDDYKQGEELIEKEEPPKIDVEPPKPEEKKEEPIKPPQPAIDEPIEIKVKTDEDKDKNKKDEKDKKDEKTKEKEGSSNKCIKYSLIAVVIIAVIFILGKFLCPCNKTGIILIRVKDAKEMNEKVGDIIIETVKKNPKAVLGFASGSTPKGIYKYIAEKYKNNEVSFKDVTSFNLDEYCEIPISHKQSYYTYMHENLFNNIDIKEENAHLPPGEGKNLEENANKYNALLKEHPIDLQMLSIGGNGHFGFNEPGTPFESVTHIVKMDEKTRKEKAKIFGGIDKVPAHAITMGIQNVLDAKNVIIPVSGKGKAPAVKNLIEGEMSIDCPVTAMKQHKGTVYVIADEEACSLLSK